MHNNVVLDGLCYIVTVMVSRFLVGVHCRKSGGVMRRPRVDPVSQWGVACTVTPWRSQGLIMSYHACMSRDRATRLRSLEQRTAGFRCYLAIGRGCPLNEPHEEN